ncbi:RES family NAD+ phosphorylase [Sphingomonas sp.]|uniref:RES family NAD+ phosphorylase n=1 Tax=Sphingomonas sp. TaxID=28214 RepID=UPI003F7305AE
MAGLAPTNAFAGVGLDIAVIDPGLVLGRIHHRAFPEPLGFGKAPSRFSDPRRRKPENRFGVLYLGSSLKVCFVETILRDHRDGVVGDVPIAETEMTDRLYSGIAVTNPLRLIDLRGDSPLRMGIPSDVVRGRTQQLARRWSLAIHQHPEGVDGIIYPSRLNGEENLAIYDRAIAKLAFGAVGPLELEAGIDGILNDLRVALV